MAKRAEIASFLPGFGMNDEYGGRSAIAYGRSNEMCWTALTSRGQIEFALIESGFRVLAPEVGVGIIYDNKGELLEVSVDVLSCLGALLDLNLNTDEEITEFEYLESLLEDSEDRYEVYVELKEKRYTVLKRNKNTWEAVVAARGQMGNDGAFVRVNIDLKEMEFDVLFMHLEDTYGVGIGFVDETMGEGVDETIGTLPGDNNEDEDEEELGGYLISRYISTDCNFTTFLDSPESDRFERLARRIFRV